MADEQLELLTQGNPEQSAAPQTTEERELALWVQQLFREAWDAKQQLGLYQIWRKCDDYKRGRQNPKQSEDHPGSTTNITHRIIESQIADLVDKPYSVAAKGWEPGDDMFSEQAQNLMDFILYRNSFIEKLNTSEHDRLELGTTIIKVWFEPDELDGRGLPVFEPISPANFFPDPKVKNVWDFQKGEFVIHATPKPLSWFRKNFERGKYVQREVSIPYDPQQTFTDDRTDEVHTSTSQKALLLECYLRDEEGKLYCLHVANDILLADSRKTMKDKPLQRRNLFPFVPIICYQRRGTLWGWGDVELLMPIQDLINELDDQIRMNARLSGNPQIIVGMGAGKGFDFRKWTNKPGLRIPMRDHNAWSIVPPQNVSSDVHVRREKAFQEADLISGVPDVNRGEKPGRVTAAAAIMALQQAGQKTVIHKNTMMKQGWAKVLELLFDEVLTHWDEEMWVRIDGDRPDWKFIDPNDFRRVPRMIPNALYGVIEGEDPIKQLDDEEGNIMYRDAQYDFQLNIGNGFPNDRALMLQIITEFLNARFPEGPAITRSEVRRFLREQIGVDLDEENDMPQQQPLAPFAPPPGGQVNLPPELQAALPSIGGVT